MKNIFTELSTNQEYFSKIERKIADIILKEPEKFIKYSMSELAEIAGVSQGSINNFSKKFADGGFSDLKLKTASQLDSYKPELTDKFSNNTEIKSMLNNAIEKNTAAFKNTLDMNNEATLESVVSKILKAKRIEIYGIYQSGAVANDFYYQLLRIGISASFLSDVLTCAVSASMLDSECLFIAISSSGRTRDILDAVNIARENNVPIVCMTANANSPLAKLSDDVLITASSGSCSGITGQEIRLSQLFLIDTICNYIRLKTDANGNKHYNRIKNILDSHSVKE